MCQKSQREVYCPPGETASRARDCPRLNPPLHQQLRRVTKPHQDLVRLNIFVSGNVLPFSCTCLETASRAREWPRLNPPLHQQLLGITKPHQDQILGRKIQNPEVELVNTNMAWPELPLYGQKPKRLDNQKPLLSPCLSPFLAHFEIGPFFG